MNISQQYLTYLNDLFVLKSNISNLIKETKDSDIRDKS